AETLTRLSKLPPGTRTNPKLDPMLQFPACAGIADPRSNANAQPVERMRGCSPVSEAAPRASSGAPPRARSIRRDERGKHKTLAPRHQVPGARKVGLRFAVRGTRFLLLLLRSVDYDRVRRQHQPPDARRVLEGAARHLGRVHDPEGLEVPELPRQ